MLSPDPKNNPYATPASFHHEELPLKSSCDFPVYITVAISLASCYLLASGGCTTKPVYEDKPFIKRDPSQHHSTVEFLSAGDGRCEDLHQK